MFELTRLFLIEAHLILDVKTTFILRKSHCVNFGWEHIKNESMSLVMSRVYTLVLRDHFLCVPNWVRKFFAPEKLGA